MVKPTFLDGASALDEDYAVKPEFLQCFGQMFFGMMAKIDFGRAMEGEIDHFSSSLDMARIEGRRIFSAFFKKAFIFFMNLSAVAPVSLR